jgi:hypothetical protein
VRQEGLGKFKKITSSGIEPTTFRIIATMLVNFDFGSMAKVHTDSVPVGGELKLSVGCSSEVLLVRLGDCTPASSGFAQK